MKIYVGNLPFNTSNDELKEAFEAYGLVDSAEIIADRESGRSRGFGFVEMPTDKEAHSAIEGMSGAQLGGRTLTVNQARPKEQRRPRAGGNW